VHARLTVLRKLPPSSTALFVKALLDQIPENSHEAVITVKQEGMPDAPSNGHNAAASPLKYDPTVAFVLEIATRLAVTDEDSVDAVGTEVFDTVQGILRDSTQWHPITVSRATFYALKLLRASYDHDFANVPYLLHSIATLPSNLLARTADLALAGLTICIDQPGPLRSEMMTSPDFWKLLHTMSKNAKSAPLVFGILERGTSGNPPAIMADNYEAAVGLLNEFASAARRRAPPRPEADTRRAEQQGEKIEKIGKRYVWDPTL
jgi:brefeldin A-resistance guanine nucleotide exchange factor 1